MFRPSSDRRRQSSDSYSPLLNFHDTAVSDSSSQMLFGDVDMDDQPQPQHSSVPFPWLEDPDVKPMYDLADPSPLSMYDFGHTLPSPSDSTGGGYLSSGGYTPDEYRPYDNDIYSTGWMNENMLSSPIPVPSSPTDSTSSSFHAFGSSHFPADATFSPIDYAAYQPLPASVSPSSSFPDGLGFDPQAFGSASPPEVSSMQVPNWATNLYEGPSRHTRTSSSPTNRHTPLGDRTQRLRIPARRGSVSAGQIFQSSSAPSVSAVPSSMTRSYGTARTRADSPADAEGTIRRRRKASTPEDINPPPSPTSTQGSATSGAATLKPVLKPPKLAPSAWQLYFTDWIQREQMTGTRKLNVAQAAKEAGQEYANLSSEEKEPYKLRSQELKHIRERDLDVYMRGLTPDDYKRENAYRTAQRKAGKSRKSNVKDPNAPKKPLSAYFMFLQRIRADPAMVKAVFGNETETTKQSVLAAGKWRSMTDEERQPFLAQAEHEKMEYEAARRVYEEGGSGYGTTINFSIHPSSPPFQTVKVESDADGSESEGPSDSWKQYLRT